MRVPRVTFTVPLTVVPVSGGGGLLHTRGPAIAAAGRAGAPTAGATVHATHTLSTRASSAGASIRAFYTRASSAGAPDPRRRRPTLLRRLQSRNCPWIQRCRGCRCCRRCLPGLRWSRPFPPRRSSRNRRRRYPQRPRCLRCRRCRFRRARLAPRRPLRNGWTAARRCRCSSGGERDATHETDDGERARACGGLQNSSVNRSDFGIPGCLGTKEDFRRGDQLRCGATALRAGRGAAPPGVTPRPRRAPLGR